MNPLEAMAKEDTPLHMVALAIAEQFGLTEKLAFAIARAARDALADNVSEDMRNTLADRRHDLAAAIRAAGEEG
jgi:hypothetical protein